MKSELLNRFVYAFSSEYFNKLNPCFERSYFCQECVFHLCLEGEKMQEIPQMPASSSDKQVKLCALANRLSLIICLLLLISNKEKDIRRHSL